MRAQQRPADRVCAVGDSFGHLPVRGAADPAEPCTIWYRAAPDYPMKAQEGIQRIAAMEVRGGSAIGRAAVQALALAVAEYDGRDHADLRARLERTGQELLRLTPVMATVASAARGATQLLEDRIAAGASLHDIKAAFETWAREESRRDRKSTRLNSSH